MVFGGICHQFPVAGDTLHVNWNILRNIRRTSHGIEFEENTMTIPRKVTSSVECYHDSGEWSLQIPDVAGDKIGTVIPKMSAKCFDFACISKNNKVYIIGGIDEHIILNKCEVYDVKTNEWSSIESLPNPVKGCRAAVVENVLYVTGGVNEKGVISKDVWVSLYIF